MVRVRPATAADRPALGRYGAALMRQHHAADPRRFLTTDNPEAGYGGFLVSQLTDEETRVLVAERDGVVIGYLYASLEGTSWRDLRGPCGFVHDVYVDEAARGQGVGRRLVEAAVEWIRGHGMTEVVLWSKSGNAPAQRLFAALGFRPTLLEMTLDVEPDETAR